MLKKIGLVLLALIMITSLISVVDAKLYSINVMRISQDLYRDTKMGIYIQTQNCNEFGNSRKAILKYIPNSSDNKLIFSDTNNSYTVTKVYK